MGRDRVQPIGTGLQDQGRLDLDDAVIADSRNLVPASPRVHGFFGQANDPAGRELVHG
jgi:hypothetical protein